MLLGDQMPLRAVCSTSLGDVKNIAEMPVIDWRSPTILLIEYKNLEHKKNLTISVFGLYVLLKIVLITFSKSFSLFHEALPVTVLSGNVQKSYYSELKGFMLRCTLWEIRIVIACLGFQNYPTNNYIQKTTHVWISGKFGDWTMH